MTPLSVGSATQDSAGLNDADLIARFVRGRDGDAFAALVRRHGPMVYAVCTRTLGDLHAAEDAFQTTFLVLLYQARRLRHPERLAGWLHGVASRVSRKARAEAARRAAHERLAESRVESPAMDDIQWRDLRPVLDEELERLPEQYRAPLVLCYLESKSREEAARQLGWSPGSLKGRLERARELLRGRLARRGLALSVGTLAVVLSENAAAAAVPPAVLNTTLQAAAPLLAGQLAASALPAEFLAVAEGTGCIATLVPALKQILSVVAAMVCIGGGLAGLALYSLWGLGANEAAAHTRSLNNLRQIVLAMIFYHDVHKCMPAPAITDAAGKPLLSWRVALLPGLDEQALYDQFHLDEPWDSPHNRKLLPRIPRAYEPVLKSSARPGETYYQVFVGKGTAFEPDQRLRLPDSFPDGTSKTLFVVEAGEAVPWTKPVDLPYAPDRPVPKVGGQFTDEFGAALGDGSARLLPKAMPSTLLRALITRNGGERIDWGTIDRLSEELGKRQRR
jgi:RNA polymerase sigma factor (sigma-70 family)